MKMFTAMFSFFSESGLRKLAPAMVELAKFVSTLDNMDSDNLARMKRSIHHCIITYCDRVNIYFENCNKLQHENLLIYVYLFRVADKNLTYLYICFIRKKVKTVSYH